MSESTFACAGLVGRRGGIEPVAELECVRPQPVGRDRAARRRPSRACWRTARAARRGRRSARAAPTGRPSRHRPTRRRRPGPPKPGQRGRHHERHVAVVAGLLEREVAQPRGEESVAVVEEARGRAEHLDVARPAEALVALRAVGRDREEVAAHAPDDVLVQAVEHASEDSNQPVRVMSVCSTTASTAAGSNSPGQPSICGVPEAVEREAATPGRLLAVAGEVEHAVGCRIPQRPQMPARPRRAPRRGAR